MQLLLNICAMLMAVLAVLAMFDAWATFFGQCVGWDDCSFTKILGYFFWPFAWLLGVDASECSTVAELLGIKVFTNEFAAYVQLKDLIAEGALSNRAVSISTFALCSFANFSSMGIALGALVPLAPER